MSNGMNHIMKLLTTVLVNKFSSTEAGSRIMGITNSAKQANELWQKFQPKTIGE